MSLAAEGDRAFGLDRAHRFAALSRARSASYGRVLLDRPAERIELRGNVATGVVVDGDRVVATSRTSVEIKDLVGASGACRIRCA